jgi:hypothetical protein
MPLKGDVTMTRNEFYQKYGDVKVKFSDYYKYTFTYTGNLPDGGRISVDYGGNADQIYRHEVGADCEKTVSSIEPYSGRAYDKDGKEVDQFYDY